MHRSPLLYGAGSIFFKAERVFNFEEAPFREISRNQTTLGRANAEMEFSAHLIQPPEKRVKQVEGLPNISPAEMPFSPGLAPITDGVEHGITLRGISFLFVGVHARDEVLL